jgi:hypothetical protein
MVGDGDNAMRSGAAPGGRRDSGTAAIHPPEGGPATCRGTVFSAEEDFGIVPVKPIPAADRFGLAGVASAIHPARETGCSSMRKPPMQ